MGTEVTRRELEARARWSSLTGEERPEYAQAVAELKTADEEHEELREAHRALDRVNVPREQFAFGTKTRDFTLAERISALLCTVGKPIVPKFGEEG